MMLTKLITFVILSQSLVVVVLSNCSGHGDNNPDGTCDCARGWQGNECESPDCESLNTCEIGCDSCESECVIHPLCGMCHETGRYGDV